jgi:hypothetical protein
MKRNVVAYLIISAFMLGSVLYSGCGKVKENPFNFKDNNSKTTDVLMENVDQPSPTTTDGDFGLKDEKKSKGPSGGYENTGSLTNEEPGSPPPPPDQNQDKIDNTKIVQDKVPSKIIKTADIKFQVKNYNESRKKILDLVKVAGAYVQSENQTNYNTSIDNIIVIRVKSEGFDDLVEKLLLESIYTDSKKIVADDVTEQFVDIQARVKSKKEVELQYLDLLKKAKSIYEILLVQQYIRTIREEIDAFEGRLKYMSDRAEYSTINLTFYEKIPSTLAPSPENNFWYRVGNAFSGGWKVMLSIFVGIVALWPLWVIGAITLIIIIRLVRRKKKAK